MTYIHKYVYDDLRGRIFPSMNVADGPPLAVDRPTPHLHLHCYSLVDPRVGLCPMATLSGGGPALRLEYSRLEYPSAARKRGSRYHPIDELRRRSGCMKNAVLLVPGHVVTNSFLLKAVVCQVAKAHPSGISNTHDDPCGPPLVSPANAFFVARSVSVTLRSGLVLLLCSRLALNPLSLKTT